jgi:quaternary ammonium compound-resistance protein SugE
VIEQLFALPKQFGAMLIRKKSSCSGTATGDGGRSLATAWLALFLAGMLEVAWALGLKYSDGFTRLWPSLVTILAIALSFVFMGVSLKSLPFGTAYAVWTGIGAAGTMIIGMAAFGEPTDVFRMTCLVLIVAGTVGLKLMSS